MALYVVKQKSFINGSIVEEGETVEYDGDVSENLELVEEKKAVKKGGKAPASEDQAGE